MITAIIQARMLSTRLPGKMLMKILGKTVLWHVVQSVKRSKKIEKIVIATSTDKSDDPIVKECNENTINVFRGNLENVLDRYYNAAKKNNATTIIRITGDCPLIDAKVVDELIDLFEKKNYDYASNNNPPSYPHGLDAEVFSFNSLETAWKEAKLNSELEHVTPYIRKSPNKFRIGNKSYKENLSELRWTLDYKTDFDAISRIYSELGDRGINHKFNWLDVLQIVRDHPDINQINSGFDRLEGYKKSVKNDKK